MVATQDDGLESCMVYEVEHPLQGDFEHFLEALTSVDENFHQLDAGRESSKVWVIAR